MTVIEMALRFISATSTYRYGANLIDWIILALVLVALIIMWGMQKKARQR